MLRTTARKYLVGMLVVAGVGGGILFVPRLATDDERALLRRIARSQPVTTCLALGTVTPSGYLQDWSHSQRAAELSHAYASSKTRTGSLMLDAESLIDNSLKLECADRATLSTPRFFGNLAFVEISGTRAQTIIAFEKIGGRWEEVAREYELVGTIIS